jgi:hypothetical protein
MRKRIKPNPSKSGARIKQPDTPASPDKRRPVFCLEYLDRDYCLSRCTKEEKAAFADTLHKLSKLDWLSLKLADRKGIGYEKIDRKSIKGSIPAVATSDVIFIRFRFYGKKPIVGFRAGRVLHIIWVDRNHTLYT